MEKEKSTSQCGEIPQFIKLNESTLLCPLYLNFHFFFLQLTSSLRASTKKKENNIRRLLLLGRSNKCERFYSLQTKITRQKSYFWICKIYKYMNRREKKNAKQKINLKTGFLASHDILSYFFRKILFGACIQRQIILIF